MFDPETYELTEANSMYNIAHDRGRWTSQTMTTQLWYVADVPLPTSKEQRTHIPRYKNRQTNASHHGNQSGSSGPEVPFARSPERRCPTSSRPTSVHATNTSIRNGNFKSSPLGFIQPTRTTNHTIPSLGVHLLDHAHWLLSPFGSETLDAPID